MLFKTKPVALKTISSRILAGVACALLFMTTAGATVVTTDPTTGVIFIDFTADPFGGYYNEFLVDAVADSADQANADRLPVKFIATVVGEYYTPKSSDISGSGVDGTAGDPNYIPGPAEWTLVNADSAAPCFDQPGGVIPQDPCDPDDQEIGVYVSGSGGGMGLSSTVDDAFASSPDLDGCQDFTCVTLGGLLWEGLNFSFYTDVNDDGQLDAGDTPLVVKLTAIGFTNISASDNEDYNLTVINGTGEMTPYIDQALTLPNEVKDLLEGQEGDAFRVWVDSEEDDIRITGLQLEIMPVPLPASLPLMAGGLLSFFGLMRRRAKK